MAKTSSVCNNYFLINVIYLFLIININLNSVSSDSVTSSDFKISDVSRLKNSPTFEFFSGGPARLLWEKVAPQLPSIRTNVSTNCVQSMSSIVDGMVNDDKWAFECKFLIDGL